MFSLETSGTSCSQRCWLKTAGTFPTQTPCTTRLNINNLEKLLYSKDVDDFQDPDKGGTARRHLSSMIESENTNVYSLEVKFLFGVVDDDSVS